jgi:hypothetical protein
MIDGYTQLLLQPIDFTPKSGILSDQVVEAFAAGLQLCYSRLQDGNLMLKLLNVFLCSLSNRSLSLTVIRTFPLELFGREMGDFSSTGAGFPPFRRSFVSAAHRLSRRGCKA